MQPPARQRSQAPHQLFFQTAEQRTALARQRFFEEGERPSGLVGEAVLQSWLRCCSEHRQPTEAVQFEAVSRSRSHASLNRNQQLLQAGNSELGHMEAALGGTDCRVLLTDAHGVIIHATAQPASSRQPLLHAASRVGVNIAEQQIGTSAPGIVVRTGQACTVDGAEHFHQCLQGLYCAAAPIHDIYGQLAGVLDVSVEGGRFPFDALAVVGTYATTIENRLLQLQSTEHLVLQFQASPTFLDTPLEALAGVGPGGQVLWLNSAARRLTGLTPASSTTVDDVFGASVKRLLDLLRQRHLQMLRLPNGLSVWMKAQLRGPDGVDFNHAVATPATSFATAQPPSQPRVATPSAAEPDESLRRGHFPTTGPSSTPTAVAGATLVDHSQRLIETTLAECGGNIARAARALGVSRGMLYRRLRRGGAAEAQSGDRG